MKLYKTEGMRLKKIAKHVSKFLAESNFFKSLTNYVNFTFIYVNSCRVNGKSGMNTYTLYVILFIGHGSVNFNHFV